VVSDVPVDDDATMCQWWLSGIYRSGSAQSFGGAHRDMICVRVFIGVSVRACCERANASTLLWPQWTTSIHWWTTSLTMRQWWLSGIYRSDGAQSFRCAHKDRVCVRVFIGVSVRACCECANTSTMLWPQWTTSIHQWTQPLSSVLHRLKKYPALLHLLKKY
jgi:hypothetical protein